MTKKKRKTHRTVYRKANAQMEIEGRKQCFRIYGSTSIALYRYHNKRKDAIGGLFDLTGDIWLDCAADHDHSMIQMCEQETGIEIQNGNGKSWEDLPYLNATLDTGRMSNAQWVYMRYRQKDWIAPQVMACIMVAMHRKYGWGFPACSRIYGEIQRISADYGDDPERIRQACREETGIDVSDAVTRRREHSV